jgi:ELWxxDGT repeat protein
MSVNFFRPTKRALLLALFALSLDTAHGQTASLVRDINSAGHGQSALPGVLYSVPGKVFFFGRHPGDDGIWASDGTSAGTSLLADVCPNSDCSPPEAFLGDVGGTVLWRAESEQAGFQLWRSDGTRPGTYPLTGQGTSIALIDFKPFEPSQAFFQGAFYFTGCQEGFDDCKTYRTDGSVAGTVEAGFHAFDPTPVDDQLFFVTYARTSSGRYELRASDGAPGEGTLLAQFDYRPRVLTAVGNRLFFVANVETPNTEVWVSDGTPAGTRAATAFPAGGGPFSYWLKPVGSRVYFLADDIVHGMEIWVTEGTPESTRMVTDFGYELPFPSEPGLLEEVNGRLVFLAYDGIHPDYELWTNTGTPESTAPLPETCLSCQFHRSPLIKAGGRLLFRGLDAEHGTELWSTDGTPAGTRLVADICPGTCDSITDDEQVLPWPGGALLLPAHDGVHGDEIWFSDGTAAGTRRMTDLADESALSDFESQQLVAMGGGIYFGAQISSEEGGALWATRGDPSSTRIVSRMGPTEPSSNPDFPTAAGDRLYFAALDGTVHGLWSTLGTPGSTALIQAALSDGFFVGQILWVSAAGGLTYFFEQDYPPAARLWRTDGTPAGTFVLTRGERFETPGVAFQGKLYLATPTELWVSDGTEAGTGLVLTNAGGVRSLAAVGGALYFATENEVWRSNGTAAGTVKLADAPEAGSRGARFTASGPLVFFTAGDGVWKTDGTPGGTQKLGEPGHPTTLTTFQGGIAFFADAQQGIRALWRSDGTAAGTVEIRSLLGLGRNGQEAFSELAVFAGKLFFAAYDVEHGAELWTSDGTANGTVQLRDITAASPSSFPRLFTVAGGRLFFVANDGVHGAELWVSDGTANGTRMVQDLYPYAHSSDPGKLTTAGNRLYFTADDGIAGRELWSLDLAAGPGCQPTSTRLCLNNRRFQAEAAWKDFQGNRGAGQAVALTADTGYFWFFSPSNVEAVLKVLDGRGLNNHFWAFYGALSSVEYHLTLTDTQTGAAKRYFNPPGQLASVGDTNGFGPLGAFSKTSPELSPLTLVDSRVAPITGPCLPTAERLCLNGGRFAVEANWKDFQGKTGTGKAVNLTSDTGWFWFFDAANVEVMLKVLDGTPLNGKHWVFYGALSSVEYTITVTDTQTGAQKTYKNPSGSLASVADTRAF